MIVANHSTKAIDLLLPELERGLFDSSWRIRLSSIQLVGELLFRISGISGKAELDDDVGNEEEEGTTYHSNSEAARKMLEVLGKEKRDRVLSGLYILRQDSAGQVRTFSIGVWKALVSHTPRTVREMLPSLSKCTCLRTSLHKSGLPACPFSANHRSPVGYFWRRATRGCCANAWRALQEAGRAHPWRNHSSVAASFFRLGILATRMLSRICGDARSNLKSSAGGLVSASRSLDACPLLTPKLMSARQRGCHHRVGPRRSGRRESCRTASGCTGIRRPADTDRSSLHRSNHSYTARRSHRRGWCKRGSTFCAQRAVRTLLKTTNKFPPVS